MHESRRLDEQLAAALIARGVLTDANVAEWRRDPQSPRLTDFLVTRGVLTPDGLHRTITQTGGAPRSEPEHVDGEPIGRFRKRGLIGRNADAWDAGGNAAGLWANYLARNGRQDEAAEQYALGEMWFTRAIELKRGDATYLERRGILRLNAGRPQEALVDLRAALSLDPSKEPTIRRLIEQAERQSGEF